MALHDSALNPGELPGLALDKSLEGAVDVEDAGNQIIRLAQRIIVEEDFAAWLRVKAR